MPVPLWFLEVLRPPVWGVARLLFRIRFAGVEHVPLAGPVVLAPNHVSYMDPVLLTIPVRRTLHYMTLDVFFGVPDLVLANPVLARQACVDHAVCDVSRHLLRANEHALDLGVVDRGEIGARVDVDAEAGAREELHGRLL